MNKLYITKVLPDGYGEGVVTEEPNLPTMEAIGFVNSHRVRSKWKQSLASLPTLLIHPSLNPKEGGWIEQWREGFETVGFHGDWHECSKSRYDSGIDDCRRKVILPLVEKKYSYAPWIKRYADLREKHNMEDSIGILIEEAQATLSPPPGGNTPASEGYWVEIPITKLPEKDGWYVLVAHGAIELVRWYDSVNGWDIPEAEYGYKHYLIRSQSPPSLQEREKGMKWVKASERLPESYNITTIARIGSKQGVIIKFEAFVEFSGRGFFQTFHDKNTPDFKNLEWLDESEDTAKQSK